MKTMYYVATVVRAYRLALDRYFDDPEEYVTDPKLVAEVGKVSHRHFTTGFFYGDPKGSAQNYTSSSYIKEYSFTGKVLSYDENTGSAVVEQRNKMDRGDVIEMFGPGESSFLQVLDEMYDNDTGEKLDSAPHAQQILKIRLDRAAGPGWLIRKRTEE